ncbi:DUF3103 family protein [Deinococcus radiotolerans]|uniref:Lipoprotein n=1 Tax=Deinococcus radiotolerans TaxID=1309407 RepID=A0ABQ2FPW7_9DEIO|nr:DUF3103 family protein [Deinococcus radiotolerans]GGL15230.1 hypothetical protein GCM10010844_37530 [Deinococcus radiotolerans]
MPHLTRALAPALLGLTLALASCGQTPGAQPTPEAAQPAAPGAADTQTNAALERFAQDLARQLPNPDLRRAVQEQVALRFDGDQETLFSTLAVRPAGQSTVQGLLTRGGLSVSALNDVTRAVPHLQVAVRGPQWNPDTYTPLVAVAAQGGDEFAPVVAFDAQGRRHVLDGRTPPSQPVVVVGVAERVDDQGNVMIPAATQAGAATLSEPGAGIGAQACDSWERLISLYVRDDHEPWSRGDPEIYVQLGSNSHDGLYLGSLTDVNDENKWYTPNRDLIRWTSATMGNWMMYLWYERDGGSSITLTFGADVKGVNGSVSYTVADGDDQMGHATLAFGDRLQRFALDTGDVRWWRGGCE